MPGEHRGQLLFVELEVHLQTLRGELYKLLVSMGGCHLQASSLMQSFQVLKPDAE
jgi:hypothetical protein